MIMAAPLPPSPPSPNTAPPVPPLPPLAPGVVGLYPLPPLPMKPALPPLGCAAVPLTPLPAMMLITGISPRRLNTGLSTTGLSTASNNVKGLKVLAVAVGPVPTAAAGRMREAGAGESVVEFVPPHNDAATMPHNESVCAWAAGVAANSATAGAAAIRPAPPTAAAVALSNRFGAGANRCLPPTSAT